MRRIGAGGDDLPPLDVLADWPTAVGRPAIRAVMIQSIDGAVSIDGRSAPLGGPGDTEVYLANRSLADVVLVGAETVRAEGYGPARLTPALVARRERRGQPPRPPIAVVSRSLRLDETSRFFTDAAVRPIVITTDDAPPRRVARLEEVADVIVAGTGDVDLAAAVRELGRRGAHRIVCEGGPTLNAALVTAGLLDEVCLTVAPVVVGHGPRVLGGVDDPLPLTVRAAYEHGGFVVLITRPADADDAG